MSRGDEVWNRAALDSGGPSPREGDVLLAATLAAHAAVMNGGVAHAVRALGRARLTEACAGLRRFGLGEVASLFETAAAITTAIGDSATTSLDAEYARLVPDDQLLADRFEADFATHEDDYAPP